MDFSAWSPSHTLLALFIVVGFIGQVAVLFYRTGQTEKRIDKMEEVLQQQSETFFHTLGRHEERLDKRFVEVNQQIVGLRTDMNQGFSDVRSEMNQRFLEMNQRLSDMQAEIGDVRSEMRLLNQNHIEHLTHHN